MGQSGSQYITTSDIIDALAKIGIEQGPASKVLSKLHEHSLSLWAMACGHSFKLQLWRAPIMIAEKHELFFSLLCIKAD